MTASTGASGAIYRARGATAAAEERRAAALSLRLSWARFGAFLLLLLGGGFGIAGLGSGRSAPWLVAGAGVVALAGFISWHDRVIRRERACTARRRVNEQALARLERRFEDLPVRAFPESAASRATALDLNLFGPGSVAQWLGAVATPSGREALAAWLTESKGSAREVVERQGAVGELAPLLDFRQELEVAAMPLAATSAATARFVEWAAGKPFTEVHPRMRAAGRASAIASLATFLLAACGLAPIHLWLLVLVANYAWTWWVKGALEAEMERLSSREGAFSGYAVLLRLLAGREFTAPGLVALRARLAASGLDAAAELGRLHRLSELSDIRHSSVHTLLQAAMAWDLLLLERVAAWQRRAGRFTGEWLAAAGEFEVLAAFAGVRFDHPDWALGEIDPAADRLTARGLGHPLLPDSACVGNDVEVGPSGRLLLVTGSNMSGKSTLLRAIGVNALLAQAGAPVCASQLRLPPLVVETSGRIDDSLVEGVSFFLAELQRLQKIVAAATAAVRTGAPRVLFLLDEILRGTNSEERRIAVARIVERLLASGAIGAVSTHDLEIARVPALAARLHNVHFRETVEEGPEGPRMTFDYRLREGLATTTNALVLLRLVGLDGPPEEPGNQAAAPRTMPPARPAAERLERAMPMSRMDDNAAAGIGTMDHEHALELQMVRALQEALSEDDRAKVVVLMDQLETFANAHFLAEQHLMRLHAYPGFASHLVEHDRLISELRELSTRILGDPAADSHASIENLELWMLTHIHTEDEALAEFLRKPVGVEPRP